MNAPTLQFTVYPYRHGRGYGNVIWSERDQGSSHYRVSRFALRAGKFVAGHPVGGGFDLKRMGEYGDSYGMAKFRDLGYFASCFPEGDGMCFAPKNGQTDAQCLSDIRECFGWDAHWGRGVQVAA